MPPTDAAQTSNYLLFSSAKKRQVHGEMSYDD
jgi:hypothetical protein